jgi:phosphonate transport system ATP-binding protein
LIWILNKQNLKKANQMLRLEQLSKVYGDGTRALNDVSLKIEAGEFVVILGKSGAGKSTLLRCINRLVEPTSGKIFFEDQEVTALDGKRLRAVRQKIGMIFQDYNLVGRLSVRTNVLSGALGRTSPLVALVNHFTQDEIESAQHNLERLEIGNKAGQRADQLSGGQQQRVGIARALMQKPKIILADEPVASLDPATSRTILDILRRINQEDGVTVLCNLHLPELAREYAQRLIAMKEGTVVYDGPPEGLTPSVVDELYGMEKTV